MPKFFQKLGQLKDTIRRGFPSSKGAKQSSEEPLAKPSETNLSKLQEIIFKKEDILKKIGNVQQSKKEIARIKAELDKLKSERDRLMADLVKDIAGLKAISFLNDPDHKPSKEQQQQVIKQLEKAEKQKEKYEKLVTDHEEKQVKQGKKREVSYQEERDKLFKIGEDLLQNPSELVKILLPLASPQEQEQGIAVNQILKSAMQGAKFAVSHMETTFDTLGSGSFYFNELNTVRKILDGTTSYDPHNQPFFIRLLQDKESRAFLDNNKGHIMDLVNQLAPSLVAIALKELGKVDELQKEFNAKQNKISKLPQLTDKLQQLKNQSSQDGKGRDREIKKLEEKIQVLTFLQNSYSTACLLQKFKQNGLGEEYINNKLLPVVREIVNNILQNPKSILDIVEQVLVMQTTTDIEAKRAALTSILDAIDINAILKSEMLPQLLMTEGENLAKTLRIIIEHNPELQKTLTKFGLTGEFLTELTPVTLQLVSKIITNKKAIEPLYEALKTVILDDSNYKVKKAESLEEVNSLDKQAGAKKLNVVQQLPGILLQKELLALLKDRLPDILERKRPEIAGIVSKAFPKLLELLHNNAISTAKTNGNLSWNDSYKILVSPLVPLLAGVDHDFYHQMVIVATNLLQNLLKAASFEQIQAISDDIRILLQEKNDIELKDQATKRLTDNSIALLKDPGLQKVITEILPDLLQKNPQAISNIARNIIENNSVLNQYGIKEEFVNNTVSLASELISAGLSSVPKLLEVNARWTDSRHTESLSDEAEANQKLCSLVEAIGEVSKELSPLLISHIPDYLQKNKEMILELAGKAVNKVDVPSKFAQNIAERIINITPQLLPLVTNLVNSALADPKGIANIITKFLELLDSSGKEKTDKPMELVGDILEFINKKENQAFKKILEGDIPQFFTENAERLGPVVDEFLNKTTIGRNLKTKGEEIIKRISEHVPEINKLMTHFTKKEYLNVTSDVIKLLSNPEVRKLALKTLVASGRMLIQRKYTSLRTRRNKWREYFRSSPERNFWRPDRSANDPKPDLGNLLIQYIDRVQISSKTVEYSIIERDFRGIILDPQNLVPTEQVIIDGFNFDKAIFKNRSFKDSNIANCSFKKAVLDNTTNFSGATIDAKSLETLLPAIEKYNKSQKDEKDKIILDNVTIVGSISNLTFKNISMKGADFTAAQFDSSASFNGKTRNIEDILQTDLTNVKLPVNTQAEQIARHASSYVISTIPDDNRVVTVNNSKRSSDMSR